MKRTLSILSSVVLSLGLSGAANAHGGDALQTAVNSDFRKAEHKARDQYRHPLETLRFFGFDSAMTVVEISPGGGWYSDILAPALKDHGKFYAAHFPSGTTSDFYNRSRDGYAKKIAEQAEYKYVVMTEFDAGKVSEVAPAGTADLVLTFRNLHNWYMRHGDEGMMNAFTSFYNALKPGGVLGVVEHRLPEGRDMEEMKSSGYMLQSWTIDMAKKAGFVLEAKSNVNANPKDTADHPRGVWTLPPRLRLGDQDKEKYMAIGESDRMTLKFRKPE